MGCFGFHHFGTFLLFVSFVFLLVSTITSPVTSQISLLKVTLANTSSISFGALGYCVVDVAGSQGDVCSSAALGYDVAGIFAATTSDSTYTSPSLENLTKGLVLHPVTTSVAFLAFLIAGLSNRLGFFVAVFWAILAWLLVLVLLVIDFFIFTAVKGHVEKETNATAAYGPGIWCVVGAFACLFLGAIFTCFSCISDGRSRKHHHY